MRCFLSSFQKDRKSPVVANSDYDAIAALAYKLWLRRGSPIGSPEIDWQQAEREHRARLRKVTSIGRRAATLSHASAAA